MPSHDDDNAPRLAALRTGRDAARADRRPGGLLKLIFHGGPGTLLGVHVICEIASEIAGTGQAMIHNEAAVEDVIRMTYNTPTYTYGYKLAATDALPRLHPDVLSAMRLPSRASRI